MKDISQWDAAFVRALNRIPQVLRQPGFRFCCILRGKKVPDHSWKTNYGYQHPKLAGYLYNGHNYGVVTGYSDLIVLDVDEPLLLGELADISRLPETFTVQTGSGGYHYYFFCPGLRSQVKLRHPDLKDEAGDPLHLGEIQALGQYVVGPGSVHPNGNVYQILSNRSIAIMMPEELLGILEPATKAKPGTEKHHRDTPVPEIPLEEQIEVQLELELRAEIARKKELRYKKLRAEGQEPIESIAMPKNVVWRKGSRILGTHPKHGSEGGRNFQIDTATNSWRCFRHNSGGGPRELKAVMEGQIQCEDARPGCLSIRITPKMIDAINKTPEPA